MEMVIKKAVRSQRKAKICIEAPSGAGKTFTALSIAKGLANGGKILLIDTENNSSVLYADEFDFDVINLTNFTVYSYLTAMKMGVDNGYAVIVIDSGSHAWQSILEEHENIQKRDRSVNSFTAWAKITPIFNKLVSGIVRLPIHAIMTLRTKTEYVMEEREVNGRKTTSPKKVGLAAQFRGGNEYEFDVVGRMDLEHDLIIEKSRMKWLADKIINKPSEDLGKEIAEWLGSGKPIEEAPAIEVASTGPTLTAGRLAGTPIDSHDGRTLRHYLQIHGEDIAAEELEAVTARYNQLKAEFEAAQVKRPAPPYQPNDEGGVRQAINGALVQASELAAAAEETAAAQNDGGEK